MSRMARLSELRVWKGSLGWVGGDQFLRSRSLKCLFMGSHRGMENLRFFEGAVEVNLTDIGQ